ncbi:MAG: LPS assembly lipoprotein LptE, partial [Desulfobacterales bacterium]
TAESGIENVITNDIIYEFIRNGRAAAKIDDADAYLTGIIESANDEAISRQSSQTSLERRITVILSLKLKDKSGKIIWSRKSISADQAFAVTADKYETEKNKSAAIELLSKRLAENVYNRLTDNF